MDHVPDAAVEFLLRDLRDFIMSNSELISEAEDSFSKLLRELDILKAFVEDCTKSGSSVLYSLVKNVGNLVYRAEDLVETFIVGSAKHKLRGTLGQMLHEGQYKLEVRMLANEIEKIIKEIQEFYNTKAPLRLEAQKLEKLTFAEYLTSRPPIDDCVVGLQDETDMVIGLLTKGTEQLDVISIVGMYGLGKTTLAKKVFNDPQIEFHFFIRAFVEVSQDFKEKEVFLEIINSLTQVTEDILKMSEDQLGDFIRKYLDNRSYLIVLDDVCTEAAWDKLKSIFPTSNKLSRVLITTRAMNVAEYARKVSKPLQMRFLRPDESRELLRLKVFDNQQFCLPDDLQDVEVRILEICGGLPLVIVAVAGILRNNWRDVRWWMQIAVGLREYNPMVRVQIDDVIKLSFDCLPYALRRCFLYLGVFPGGSEISARTLLQLWVSEGFIATSDQSLNLEDVAASYLENLVNRSLVMVQKKSSDGQVKTIRIGDSVHEFCKARAHQENLFREIKGSNMCTDNDRRLCIDSNLPDFVSRKPSGKCVRSFLCFAKEDFILPVDHISSILRAFKLLRVLHVRCIKLTRFPPDLYYLVLLKYIAIYGDLTSLPEKVSNLWNLQTLIVYTSGTILDIKADIWKMEKLRHLETNASAYLLKTKEGSPSNANLQSLSTISPESCRKDVFDRTPMLKKLGIRGKLVLILKDDCDFWSGSLSRLENLENLKLLNKIPEKIHMLPSSSLFPTKLAKLTLLNTLLDWKDMSTLGKLRNLQVLKLKNNAFEGPVWNTEDGGFIRLKVLHIGKTDLSIWKASSSNFPVLTSLYIKQCSNLMGIPEGLQGLSTLQMIDLYCTNELLVHSARRFQVAKLRSANKFKLCVYPPDN